MSEIDSDIMEELINENRLFHERIRQAFQYGLGIDVLDAKSIQEFRERQHTTAEERKSFIDLKTKIIIVFVWIISTITSLVAANFAWWLGK